MLLVCATDGVVGGLGVLRDPGTFELVPVNGVCWLHGRDEILGDNKVFKVSLSFIL